MLLLLSALDKGLFLSGGVPTALLLICVPGEGLFLSEVYQSHFYFFLLLVKTMSRLL